MENEDTPKERKLIRLPDVQKIIPFGRTTIWAKVKEGKFPQPIKLSPRMIMWDSDEIYDFINNPNQDYSTNDKKPF